MVKCELCLYLKHRYMLLTGMHYPEIQKAIDKGELKSKDFSCEGMGCKFFAQGSEISPNMRDEDWKCPHFRLKHGYTKARLRIDSHANRNLYPHQLQEGKAHE